MDLKYKLYTFTQHEHKTLSERSQGWHQEDVPGLPVPAWQQSAYGTGPYRNQDLSAKEGQKEMEPAWIPQKNLFSSPNEKLSNKENLHEALET